MATNFFEWLRAGVRQAVLQGVSDAVETIGEPADQQRMREHLALAIEQDGVESALLGGKKSTARRGKRLGRSLKDVEAVGSKTKAASKAADEASS